MSCCAFTLLRAALPAAQHLRRPLYKPPPAPELHCSLTAAKSCNISVVGGDSSSATSPPATTSPPVAAAGTVLLQAGKWPLASAQQECVQRSSAASDAYHQFEALSLLMGTSYLFDGANQTSQETLAVLALPEVQALGNLTINAVVRRHGSWPMMGRREGMPVGCLRLGCLMHLGCGCQAGSSLPSTCPAACSHPCSQLMPFRRRRAMLPGCTRPLRSADCLNWRLRVTTR